MSTNPIIISIVDQVDPQIVVKITGIGSAARAAAQDVGALQVAVASLNGIQISNLNSLSSALGKISTGAQPAVQDVNDLSKALGTITSAAKPAIDAGTQLSDAIKLVPPAAALTETALTDMAFALRNVSNGAPAIKPLSDAIGLLPVPVKTADAALVSMAASLAGVSNSSNAAKVVGTTLADAFNLITPAAKQSDTALSNMAFALKGIAVVPPVKPLADAINLIPAPAKISQTALLGMSSALATVANTSASSVRAGSTLADAFKLLPPVAQKSDAALQNMAFALRAVPTVANAAGTASDALGNRFVNLLARVTASTLGMGRLGGAIGGLATSLFALGPLIVAALAIAAVVAAIAVYERMYQAASKLAETQAALGQELGATNDKLLQQGEKFAELTGGPLAKYQQQLKDLNEQSINVNFSNITKELEDQHSWWARIDAAVERAVALTIQYGSLKFASPANTQASPDIRDTELLLKQLQAAQEQGTLGTGQFAVQVTKQDLSQIVSDAKDAQEKINFNRKDQAEKAIVILKQQIDERNRLLSDEAGSRANSTDVQLASLKEALSRELLVWQEYYGNRRNLSAEAAKAEAEQQFKLFKEEQDRLKSSLPEGQQLTAQDQLKLVQQQISGAPRPTEIPGLDSRAALTGPDVNTGNVAKLTDEANKLKGEIQQQGVVLSNLLQKYDNAIEKSGSYSDAMKAEADTEKLVLEAKQRRIPVDQALIDKIKQHTANAQDEIRIGQQEQAVYSEFVGPIQKYGDALEAINRLLKANAISSDEAAIARNKAARADADAVNPLNEYDISLQHQLELLKQYGSQLQVATEVDRIRQDLQKQGRDLTDQQAASYTKLLTEMQRLKAAQQEETTLWEQNAGAQQKITDTIAGINKAYQDGVISLQQYKNESLAAALAQNQFNNSMKNGGTIGSNVIQVFGGLISQFKNLQNSSHPVVQALDNDWTQFFSTFEKGFANAIGQALVYNKNLGQALLDTARNAVAQLISSLVELGIQFLIVTALEKAFGINLPKQNNSAQQQAENLAIAIAAIATITAVQLAAIETLTAPAWDLAEAVSLFSFGANAVPAQAGIAAVIAAGSGAQATSGGGLFAEGGLIVGPGTPTSDNIPIMVSPGEFVVNAKSTAAHRDLIEAINKDSNLKVQQSDPVKHKFAMGGFIDPELKKFATGGFVIGHHTTQHTHGIKPTPEPKIAHIPKHGHYTHPAVKFAAGGYIDGEKIKKFATGGVIGPLQIPIMPVEKAAKHATGGIVKAVVIPVEKAQKHAVGGMVQPLKENQLHKFASGGYITPYNTDVSGSDAVNSNALHVQHNVSMKVSVTHDGSTNVQVQHISENEVRIIAKSEAKKAIQDQAPGVIAADLHNPNSRTSKAINQTVVAPRRR